MTILTFILFLYGTPVHTDCPAVVYVAEFSSRDDCLAIAEGLEALPPKGVGDPPQFSCVENVETHTYLDAK